MLTARSITFYNRHITKTETCWIWDPLEENGYGRFSYKNKRAAAHRVAWIIANKKEIPKGLCILHRCDNKACVNPGHLFTGTHLDNMRDKVKKGRQRKGDNHYARTKPWLLARGKQHGLTKNPQRAARGQKHGCAKLNDEKVRLIRKQFTAGATARDLSVRFGVDEDRIKGVAKGILWSHVT